MKNLFYAVTVFSVCLFSATAFSQNNTLNFDGINDRVEVLSNPNYDFEYGTVEMWVRHHGQVGNACLLGNRGMAGTRYSFHLSNSAVGMWNGLDYRSISYTFTQGVWYHLAFVCDPFNTSVYVNGSFIGTTGNAVQGYSNNYGEWGGIEGQPLVIGAVRDGGGTYEHFKGDLDDIRIWSHTRDAIQIASERNNDLIGAEWGLVALFKFDQGIAAGNNTGILRAIESSFANDGTMYNFAKTGGLSNFIPRHTALPVTLNFFKASKQQNTALLQWQTATEQNSKSFIVERSADGNIFIAIGNLQAAGNSTTIKSYSYEDAATLQGNNYYRLKQVDADGKTAYSDVRLLTFAANTKLSWHTQGKNTVVQLTGGSNDQYIVTDMSGATAMQGRMVSGKLLITGKPAGIYNVRVWAGGEVKTIKVVIQ